MIKRINQLLITLCGIFMLAGCGVYVPDGSTVVTVKNARREFDRATLRPTNKLTNNPGVRMQWYDTNTYITTATLSPGIYRFQAHSFMGGGISRDIEIVADKNLYEIDAAGKKGKDAKTEDAVQTGPTLKGRLNVINGRRPADVSIIFIGQEIIMKTASVAPDGTFSTTFPAKGTWRIEIHETGNPPKSYTHQSQNITGPTDLGTITLQ